MHYPTHSNAHVVLDITFATTQKKLDNLPTYY